MRGDRPRIVLQDSLFNAFTPHARGSTLRWEEGEKLRQVYPACAGIDRECGVELMRGSGLPRMRGDRPCWIDDRGVLEKFTPHARGSTPRQVFSLLRFVVYPACAGIDRRI